MDIRVIDDPFLRCPFHNRLEYHAHPEAELLYIIRGHGKRMIGGNIEEFNDGDMVFLKSMVPHIWITDPPKSQDENPLAILLYINQELFENVISGLSEFSDISNLLHSGPDAFLILGNTHSLIKNKLLEQVEATGLSKVLGIFEILNIIASSSEKEGKWIKDDSKNNGKKEDTIAEALRFIKENISNDISLASVAERVGMTSQAFCRHFRQRMEIKFSEYLITRRIEAAADFLVSSKLTVGEIAAESGFKSVSHFCKSFKRHFEISPLAYKRLNRNGKSIQAASPPARIDYRRKTAV